MRAFRQLGVLAVLVLAGCSQPAGPEASPATSSAPMASPPAWQSPDFNTESYDHIEEADFHSVATSPFSTFSIDVDTASYSNVRRFLNLGQRPPSGAVRIEELVNYFPYHYASPEGDAPFAMNSEVARCPWKPEHRLVRIGLQGRQILEEQRPPCQLIFLVDVSGSMSDDHKLPLVRRSLSAMVEHLRDQDRVAIVTYAGSSGVVLPSTSARQKRQIITAIESLGAAGGTNGAEGIQTAYRLAQENLLESGVNRVILCTDGDFNIGVSDTSSLVDLITVKAKSGVSLSVLGFGMGNYKDSLMEKLADKGNGNYAYIDSYTEARKVLIEQMAGTLVTIAKDVKIQVEFNPARVHSYRLIGYENRALKTEDFRNDQKDAGEIGAGHSVTALYEVVPSRDETTSPGVPESKYQKSGALTVAARSSELMNVRVRHLAPEGGAAVEDAFPILDSDRAFVGASADYRFAAAVASFGMLLRDSNYKGTATWRQVAAWAESGAVNDSEGYRREFLTLIDQASRVCPDTGETMSAKTKE
jgi:Ca-activated chloride channel family protein